MKSPTTEKIVDDLLDDSGVLQEQSMNTLSPAKIQDTNLSTPTQHELKKRVSRLLKQKENKICVDCSRPCPRWITILSMPPPYAVGGCQHVDTFQIGGFCCLECSGAHRRLGTHISFVRSIELDSLKESDVKALEAGGNASVNRIFEGKLFDPSMGERCISVSLTAGAIKPDSSTTQKEREVYIHNKYEKKLYTDIRELTQFRQSMFRSRCLGDVVKPFLDLASPTSSSNNSLPTSPIKLQVFTSSPRTLALIEKYMNPKRSKRKNLRRILKNSLRRRGPRSARKKYLQKSLRGLQGIVDVNPHMNVVETRSEEFGGSDSEIDFDKDFEETQSVTSTRSTMSALLRRNRISNKKRLRRYEHISTSSTRTATTPVKDKGKKSKFRRQSTKQKKNKEKGITKEEHSEEEVEVLELKDEQIPTTPKENKSPLFRLTPYLKTPKRKNVACGTKITQTLEKASCCSLAILTEGGGSQEFTEEEKSYQQEDIKSFRAWSHAIDRIMKRRMRKSQKRDDDSAVYNDDDSVRAVSVM